MDAGERWSTATIGHQHDVVPITFTFERKHGWIHIGEQIVADDILTAIYLYRFGQEPFSRLVISRPSELGLQLLRDDPNLARLLIREFPSRSQLYSFSIQPEAEDAVRAFVRERQQHLDSIRCHSNGAAAMPPDGAREEVSSERAVSA